MSSPTDPSVWGVVYADGGFDPTVPYDNAEAWWDDATRLAWTVTDGTATSRAYHDDENARADAVAATQLALTAAQTGVDTIAGALAGIATVIAAAQADLPIAQALQDAANADFTGSSSPDVPWRKWVDQTVASLTAYRLWADGVVVQLATVVQTAVQILAKEASS